MKTKSFIKNPLLIILLLFLNSILMQAQDTFVIRSAINNSLVLSAENKKIKSGVKIKTYNKKKTQQWVLIPSNERGYFYLKSKAGDNVLDVKNGSSNIRTPVWMYALNNNSAQKWQKIPAGNGYYYLKSKLGTFLDVQGGTNRSGTPVWMYSPNHTNAQKWKFEPVNQSLIIPTECALTNCYDIKNGNIKIVHDQGKYIVSDELDEGLYDYHFSAPTRSEAIKIKDILFNKYDINRYCVFENVVFPYRNGNLIAAGILGEDCIPFNSLNLTVQKRKGKWIIKDGNNFLLQVSSKSNALKMICLIQKVGARKICYVGRPDPSLIYLRS